MSKLTILKDKISNKRVGEVLTSDSNIYTFKFNFQYNPEYKKVMMEFIDKNFNTIDLSKTSNKKGRGSVTRSRRYTTPNTREVKE